MLFNSGIMRLRTVAFVNIEAVVGITLGKRSHAAVAENFGANGGESDDGFFDVAFDDSFLIAEMSRRFETAIEENEKIVGVEIRGEATTKRPAGGTSDFCQTVGDALFYTKRNAVFVN